MSIVYFLFTCVFFHSCPGFMSRIQRKYCLISTSYLAGLFDIFILLHVRQNCVWFGDLLPMRTLCDPYHEEFESH